MNQSGAYCVSATRDRWSRSGPSVVDDRTVATSAAPPFTGGWASIPPAWIVFHPPSVRSGLSSS